MIKQILINEIKDAIGHIPSKKEYKSCLSYLSDTLNAASMMVEVETAINDWCHDELVKCEVCGDYILPDDVYEDIDGYKMCSYNCVLDFYGNLGI